MPLRNLTWVLVVPGLVALGMAIGVSAPPPANDYRLVGQVLNVLGVVDERYVRKLSDDDRKKLVENMINGGLHQLDPHSEYFNAERLKEFKETTAGNFGGVGITLTIDSGTKFLKVDHPMPGTPAYDAGVLAGDLIVKVGEDSTTGMTVEDARQRITGPVGTQVVLTIRRVGREPTDFPVTLTRAEIAIHPITGVARQTADPLKWDWFIDPKEKIALIRLSTFNDLASNELRAAVAEIEAAGGRAIILDLRDNPGGLLSQAIDVADTFLGSGPIVTTKNRDGVDRVVEAKAATTAFLPGPGQPRPMAVLVNRESASASEIVAAALQDHHRAVVIGERTFGKGSVQKLIPVPPDETTALKLTVESYWRPSGKNIHRYPDMKESDDWGVRPDPGFEVPQTTEERIRHEFELRRVGYVPGKPGLVGPNPPARSPLPTPKGSDGKPLFDDTKPYDDKVLDRALDYLRKKLAE